MLLARVDIYSNTVDKDGQTPLFWSAYLRHEEVVNLFLKRVDVDPNTTDKDGQQRPFWAAHHEHEGL